MGASAIKKLEFGILELFVGTLMVIGIIGYFGHVSADLDWLDHTISFLLFTYLFYKLNITSILFGQTRRGLNALIVVSFFLLFFKDIISYTLATPNEFHFLTFVFTLQQFFAENIDFVTNATFYAGLVGLVVASVSFALSDDIAHPSFAYVLFPQMEKRRVPNIFLCFVMLLAFYYFVYNMILEWLEFVLDDPIITTGIVFYIHSLASRKERFHPESFVFRIGEFSEKLYTRFISLFHCKKTLPLGISGLLILHALADMGVFAYALTFGKENLYLERLEYEHPSFMELFAEDAEHASSGMVFVLGALYILNALSLWIIFLIPVVVWWRIFTHKEIHLGKGALFVIYASVTAFFLLPAYNLYFIGEENSTAGVDIIAHSLLDASSPLESMFQGNHDAFYAAVLGLSLLAGVLALTLGLFAPARKELYAFAIACALLFFGIYLYNYMSSVLFYFGTGIADMITGGQGVLAALFGILFLLSILFYVLGYLLFLYEVVMEYHTQKWSEPVDEEIVKLITMLRRAERRLEHKGAPQPAPLKQAQQQQFPRR